LRYDDAPDWKFVQGGYNVGQDRRPELVAEDAKNLPPAKFYVLAWDPVENKERFRVDARGGGVLATAADLVFQGRGSTIEGELVAFDATNGEQVWSYPMPNEAVAAPISYMIDGEQYIAINTGSRATGRNLGTDEKQARARQPGRLVAFKLGGTATLPPPPGPAPAPNPPDDVFADDVVRAGELLYADYCSRCHGGAASSLNVIPDLRRSAALTNKELWHSIVIDGALTDSGMIGWTQFIDATQSESIRAYVARKAVALRDALLAEAAVQPDSGSKAEPVR
jgi:quinohemoprotein ethanol dehydrogenase